jgi:trehalose/maltose hydrolase-like predicted phosphorylase
MKPELAIKGFDESKGIQNGNAFLLGNGHLGYRGTYEEDGARELTGLNIQGVYDRCGSKWRESINMPNPFFLKAYVDGVEVSLHAEKPIAHRLSLDMENAVLSRLSEFKDLIIKSTRFVSSDDDSLLSSLITFEAKRDLSLKVSFGIDLDIFDINGPHFASKKVSKNDEGLLFVGLTNEGKRLYEESSYSLSKGKMKLVESGIFEAETKLRKGEVIQIVIKALVLEEEDKNESKINAINQKPFASLLLKHEKSFNEKWKRSYVEIATSDEEAALGMAFSVYELLILGDRTRDRSISARGLSGQTYKGAVFWDSEIFILPFFLLTDPAVAKNLIMYRIKTLEGAKSKAREFGFKGAFYAWESQDSGLESCSKYNVTDPVSGMPLRTYFNEKQIHISADIPFAIDRYVKASDDTAILENGALEVLVQCCLFFMSYATLGSDGLYHLNDVIGPDEYHERVNDNAFTNYMAEKAMRITLSYLSESSRGDRAELKEAIGSFAKRLYLPKPNRNGVIEQFSGYFSLEDVDVKTVKSRLRNPRDYWGGPHGVATKTQIIKQADVVAMLVLLGDEFSLEVKKANYEYYFKRTEHGSSLSASMYSLLGAEIGKIDESYGFYRQSALIDIIGANKLFAGGVYIGGTHPASNGGAYLSLVYGFAGLKTKDGQYVFSPRLPKEIDGISIPYVEKGKRKRAIITKDRQVQIKEED